jgi:hypothetical protein
MRQTPSGGIMGSGVKRVPREHLNQAAYPIFLRWCGVAGVLGGLLFVVWGYIDRRNTPEHLMAVVHILAFIVPALFLVAVVGLSVLWRSRLGVLGWAGLVLTVYGWGMSVVEAVAGFLPVWAFFAQRGWSPYLLDWVVMMLAGLTLMGVATARRKQWGGMGALVLVMAALGWGYYLTDTGAVLEARSVHIGFGLLFSLGWVVLGVGLLAAGTWRAQSPQVLG